MFERCKAANVQGGRRPLRFRPADAKLSAGRDRHGPFIDVCFTAPPGCYATVLIDEICKA
jgi:tRNA(Glu) U13 pseudouridine synthase TruD